MIQNEPAVTTDSPAMTPGTPDTAQILALIGDVAYEWRLDSDVLSWGGNVADVLLIKDRGAIATGRAFAQFLEAENAQTRFDVIMKSDKRDEGHGVAYQI